MANQDPQPEIYTTRHNFDASTVLVSAGTTNLVTIYTNQANNEEVRLYGIAVRIIDENGDSVTTFTDFAMSIQVGPNNVPSNQFDVGWLHTNLANGGGVLMLPTPVLALFQQPLAVIIEAKSAIAQAANRERTVVVDLIGELAIQKAPPGRQ
jgi:hydrogenase-4 membrane subunit HyfE